MGKRIPIFLGIMLVGLAVWLLISPNAYVRIAMERFENAGYDLQLRMHAYSHKPTLSPVAIVDLDDKSLQAEGHWPWPRAKLAKLVDKIAQQGVASISFDIFFSEPQPNLAEQLINKLNNTAYLTSACAMGLNKSKPLFAEDAMLATSLAKARSILAVTFSRGSAVENTLPISTIQIPPEQLAQLAIPSATGYIANIPVLQQAASGTGFINTMPDSDGSVRQASLLMKYQNSVYPALALGALLPLYSNQLQLITPSYGDKIKLEEIKFGNYEIPTDEIGRILIPFIGKDHTFPYYSATDILNDKIPAAALLGKYIILGTSAIGLGDLHVTPIQASFPGVEIQANILNGILQHNIPYVPAWSLAAIILFIIISGLFAAFLFPRLGPNILAALIIIIPITLFYISDLIWLNTGYILSVLLPIVLLIGIALLNIMYGYFFETGRRKQLKNMFGQYVPEEHIDEMLNSKAKIALGGEARTMSVLFADVRNFTTISETMSATALVEMLNEFFTPMTEVIFSNEGTIDKYVGDMIMAFWGAPLEDKNHQYNAMESALGMQAKLATLAPTFAERKFPEIKIGIGINSGVMTVGDVGSKYRLNYTVLGDAVNLGSRVEGLTKFYGVGIIVTEYTCEGQDAFIYRLLDKVRVKGRQSGVKIYEVVAHKNELTPALENELSMHHEAIQYYFAQNWDDAGKLFNELNQKNQKKIYAIYLERISEIKNHPLPPDWDGVYEHHSK